MTQATECSTTLPDASNPDAKLLRMIERRDTFFRVALQLDETGDDDGFEELTAAAYAIEDQIKLTRAYTLRGYRAKCRALAAEWLCPDDLMLAAFMLGRDAERLRLGIMDIPAFLLSAPRPTQTETVWQEALDSLRAEDPTFGTSDGGLTPIELTRLLERVGPP